MPAAPVFSHPALLLGIGGALVPILIHLLLRPRPRRTRFPALGLLRAALASGQRASRLRNLLLMLVRALLLGLAALLLAGPTCAPSPVAEFVAAQPAACVVVLDDSGSMGYRLDGDVTLFDLARERALEFVESSAAWPEGSTLALLRAGMDEPRPRWTADRAALVEALHPRETETKHARPLGGALRSAVGLLQSAGQPAKRIVVFTDGTAHAWDDVTPATLAGLENLALRVVVSDDPARSNIAIRAATGPRRRHPATAPVPLRVTLAADGRDSQCWLLVRREARTLRRVGPFRLSAGEAREIDVELPALEPGSHAITLQLEPPDHLDLDQRRFVALQSAPPPVVWLVTPPGKPPDADVAALILRNLLAPEALTPEQQLVELSTLPADRLTGVLADADRRRPPVLVIVLSDAECPPAAARRLLRRVEQGTTVLLVPGSLPDSPDWPDWPGLRPLLSAAAPTDDPLPALTTLRWEPDSPYAASPELAELTRCAVHRRLRLGRLSNGVVVQARYADGLPAIVSKPLGRGRLMALTVSPDPQWGDLGVRAAGLMTWLHTLVDEAAGPPDAVAAFALGQQTRHRFAALPTSGMARVALQTEPHAKPTWTRLAGGTPEKPWPTERAGVYSAQAPGAERPTATYVVNWPPEESRLEPIGLPQLRRLLGHAQVSIDSPRGQRATSRPTLVQRLFTTRDLRTPLAALLLAAFVLEAWLSARRRPAAPASAETSTR